MPYFETGQGKSQAPRNKKYFTSFAMFPSKNSNPYSHKPTVSVSQHLTKQAHSVTFSQHAFENQN